MEPQDSEVITLREDNVAIRHGGDDIGSLLAHNSSHAVGDPNFAPIGKLPVEVLVQIFVQCLIPWCKCDGPVPLAFRYRDGMHPQLMRQHLGQVCRLWNTIVDNEPRIWATFVLYDGFLDPKMVSLWIKKSRSHPLDVFFWSQSREKRVQRRHILAMLHREFWRIHILVGDLSECDISALFPLGVSTEAPMMQTFMLSTPSAYKSTAFGGVHCPQLHSLSVSYFTRGVDLFARPMQNVHQLDTGYYDGPINLYLKLLNVFTRGVDLFARPMQNVHQLDIDYYDGPIHLYLKLLNVLPNLVSLKWKDALHGPIRGPIQEGLPRVNLRSLRFLTVECKEATRVTGFLACFLNESPDTLSRDENINLRYLKLQGAMPMDTKIPTILHRLKHLITLILDSQSDRDSLAVDALLLTLSSLNQDFSSVCPQLKTVGLTRVSFSPSILEHFVKRRVKSDLDDLAPDLVTSLVLVGHSLIGEELRAQFAQTHSSSITFTDIPRNAAPWRYRIKMDPRTKAYRCCVKFTE